MIRYSIEQRTKKYVKGYDFLSFVRNLSYLSKTVANYLNF